MRDAATLARFEATVLVHLDAAYNLARWLTHDEFGAEDAVQEACLRAFRFFGSLHGPSPKAWFMAVVRNACLDWLKKQQRRMLEDEYDDATHDALAAPHAAGAIEPPEAAAARASEARWVRNAIAALPREYREVVILRELEGLSYKEISSIVDVPIGTVMSRLARGRDLLQQKLRTSGMRMKS